MSFFTFTNTVGFTKKPASRPSGWPSPPASTSAPSSMPLRIYDWMRSYCFCDTIGPMAVLGLAGSPTVRALIASRMRRFISSSRLLGTRRRVPAAQACPLFKGHEESRRNRLVESSIIEQDRGRFTAQFERDALHGRGAIAHDPLA